MYARSFSRIFLLTMGNTRCGESLEDGAE